MSEVSLTLQNISMCGHGRRTPFLFDGCEKGIHIDMKDSSPRLKPFDDFCQAFYDLPMSFVDIDTHLRDEQVGRPELGKCKGTYRKLTESENPDAELGNRHHSASKLTDGDDPLCHDRYPVWPVFERDVNQGQSKEGRLGFGIHIPIRPICLSQEREPRIVDMRRPALKFHVGILGRVSHCLLR